MSFHIFLIFRVVIILELNRKCLCTFRIVQRRIGERRTCIDVDVITYGRFVRLPCVRVRVVVMVAVTAPVRLYCQRNGKMTSEGIYILIVDGNYS